MEEPDLNDEQARTRIDALRDLVAIQDEHSHVDGAASERIRQVILEGGSEELGHDGSIEDTALRLVLDLQARDVAAMVADWLSARVVI